MSGPLLSKANWTDGVWAFTVPAGVLKCYVEDSMQTFTSNRVEYGLNAIAKQFGNFGDIDEIVPGRISPRLRRHRAHARPRVDAPAAK